MNNLKSKLLKALMRVSLGALGVCGHVCRLFLEPRHEADLGHGGHHAQALRQDRPRSAPVIPTFFSVRLPWQTGAFCGHFRV